VNLRKDYDVEIKTMFLELNRVKEEVSAITRKQNGGGLLNPGGLKKDERRYDNASSICSSSVFDYSSGLQFNAKVRGAEESEEQKQAEDKRKKMGPFWVGSSNSIDGGIMNGGGLGLPQHQ